MATSSIRTCALILLGAAFSASLAHEIKHGTLTIAHPFVVADKDCPGAPTRAYLMLVVNGADKAEQLVGAQLDNGATGSIVRFGSEAGKATVTAVSQVEIAAKSNLALMAPKLAIAFPRQDKLVEGGTVPGSLRFERAGKIPVKFMVEAKHLGPSGHRGALADPGPALTRDPLNSAGEALEDC